MLKICLVLLLVSLAFSDAYKTNPQRQRESDLEYLSQQDYAGYENYDHSTYGKDTEEDNNKRPSIFSYWGKLLKSARLPSLNFTNPFSKLFQPYVVKVDFPPGTDPNLEANPTRRRRPKPQDNYIYLNSESENPQFYYDPVTQQYYQIQETNSQNYNPQNNFFATTFKDDDEIAIDVKNSKDQNQEQPSSHEYTSEDQEEESYTENHKKGGYSTKFNSPAINKLKVKPVDLGRTEGNSNQKSKIHNRKVAVFALV